MKYEEFKRELENYHRNIENIEKLKEELDEIDYEMSGVKGVRYDKERASFNPELARKWFYYLSEKRSEKELELEYLIASSRMVENKLRKLPEEDKDICMKIIAEGISAEKVRIEKGYSRSGIWKRIKRELTKIL